METMIIHYSVPLKKMTFFCTVMIYVSSTNTALSPRQVRALDSPSTAWSRIAGVPLGRSLVTRHLARKVRSGEIKIDLVSPSILDNGGSPIFW